MYTEITRGIKTNGGISTKHVVKILNIIYGKRQGSRVWNQHLTKGLEEIGFWNSRMDNCVFYQREVILIVHVDDSIFAYPSNASIEQAITNIGAKFDIEVQGILGN